jgi:hypothetical protein
MNKQTKFKQTEIGQIPEDWEYGDCFVKAVENFVDNEKFLLLNDLNERTISHNLAEYLQKYFQDYNVDCEYNRMRGKKMNEDYITKTLHLEIESSSSDSTNAITVFPDIIVHKRGDNNNNYLIIEVKKKEFANKIRKQNETYKDFDKRKLFAYTKGLQYELGIYLEFDKDRISGLKFFKDGKEL